jgi:hypothetical protein
MMPLAAFVATYQGKRVQAPGGLGGQCVDLSELWRLNLGMPRVFRNAADFVALAIAGMVWIPNTPTNAPQPGDVVVWNRNASMPEGHIDVAVSGITSMTFTGFDQNWPLGSVAHLQAHGYWDVAGWHHPLPPPPPPPPPPPAPVVPGRGGSWFGWLRRWRGPQ